MVAVEDGESLAFARGGKEAIGNRWPEDVLLQAKCLESFQGGPGSPRHL